MFTNKEILRGLLANLRDAENRMYKIYNALHLEEEKYLAEVLLLGLEKIEFVEEKLQNKVDFKDMWGGIPHSKVLNIVKEIKENINNERQSSNDGKIN